MKHFEKVGNKRVYAVAGSMNLIGHYTEYLIHNQHGKCWVVDRNGRFIRNVSQDEAARLIHEARCATDRNPPFDEVERFNP